MLIRRYSIKVKNNTQQQKKVNQVPTHSTFFQSCTVLNVKEDAKRAEKSKKQRMVVTCAKADDDGTIRRARLRDNSNYISLTLSGKLWLIITDTAADIWKPCY